LFVQVSNYGLLNYFYLDYKTEDNKVAKRVYYYSLFSFLLEDFFPEPKSKLYFLTPNSDNNSDNRMLRALDANDNGTLTSNFESQPLSDFLKEYENN
jgi:hypothetical protein